MYTQEQFDESFKRGRIEGVAETAIKIKEIYAQAKIDKERLTDKYVELTAKYDGGYDKGHEKGHREGYMKGLDEKAKDLRDAQMKLCRLYESFEHLVDSLTTDKDEYKGKAEELKSKIDNCIFTLKLLVKERENLSEGAYNAVVSVCREIDVYDMSFPSWKNPKVQVEEDGNPFRE